jgi:2-oxo-3-(phosphooxy)propyl 3-oxoalkanoate synthase
MIKRIDGKYVHKIHERNVLIADIKPMPGREGWFEAEVTRDYDHPFFFEHPLDHIPAMMLVEAGRQMGIAIAHMYLGVPFGVMFATRSFDIKFTDFAELRSPVIITAEYTDKIYRHGELACVRMDGRFSQAGREIGGMGGSWSMLRPAVWKRYRRIGQRKGQAG